MKKPKSKSKKSKLSLDDLKKKGNVHNESPETQSGEVLDPGAGASDISASTRRYDGDKQPL